MSALQKRRIIARTPSSEDRRSVLLVAENVADLLLIFSEPM